MLLTIKQIQPTRASQLVRQARRSSGITQRALAERAGISQPSIAAIERSAHDATSETVDRLVRAAGYEVIIIPTTRPSVASWAGFIGAVLKDTAAGDKVAFRSLIGLSDDLAASPPGIQVALSISPPEPCGEDRFDAAIAGVVEYHLSKAQLPIPNWVEDADRFLSERWVVTPFTEDAEVPPAFLRRGVVLAESELASL